MAAVGGVALIYQAEAGLHPADYHANKEAQTAGLNLEVPSSTLKEGTDVGNGRRVTKVKS